LNARQLMQDMDDCKERCGPKGNGPPRGPFKAAPLKVKFMVLAFVDLVEQHVETVALEDE
jgi:hypothetical protein